MTRTLWWILLCSTLVWGACADEDPGDGDGNGTGAGECGDGNLDEDEACDDNNTLSGDGCSSTCQSEERCNDDRDNDQDGDVDCDDSECAGDPACTAPAEDCDDAAEADEDEDGQANCDDPDCASDPACEEPPLEEDCDTPGDEDNDTLADCDDPDCASDPDCDEVPVEEDCDTPGDEDNDTLEDCDDPDCDLDPACDEEPVEDCDNGVDDGDDDTDVDCDDSECADDPVCLCGNDTVDTGEDCDEGADNSDTEPNACRTDCTFPTCGDSVLDTDNPDPGAAVDAEACDQGDLNNDAAPNTCRADCSWPVCGDGVVDTNNPDPGATVPSEQCDDPDDSNCDTDCTFIDPTLACGEDVLVEVLGSDFEVLDGEGVAIADTYRATGRIVAETGSLEPAAGCTHTDPDTDLPIPTGAEHVFVFTPSVGGQFVAQTDFFETTIDTVVYVRTICQNTVGEVCSDDTFASLASQTVFTAVAGTEYFIVVDTLDGDTGDFTLLVRPATTAALGEDCSAPGALCTEGFCAVANGEAVCVDSIAPVQSSFQIDLLETAPVAGCTNAGLDTWLMRIRGLGTDFDGDVTSFDYFITDVAGPNPPPGNQFIFTGLPELVFDFVYFDGLGGYDVEAYILTCDLGEQGLVAFWGGVNDAAGNATELDSVDLATLIAGNVPEQAVGETCDPSRVADFCDCAVYLFGASCTPNTACQAQDGGGYECGTAAGLPTLGTLTADRLGPDVVRLTATGADPDGDAIGLSIRITDATGTVDLTGELTDGADTLDLAFAARPNGATSWSGVVNVGLTVPFALAEITIGDTTYTPGRIYARALDELGNVSATESFVAIEAETAAELGESCDLHGIEAFCTLDAFCAEADDNTGVCSIPEFGLRAFEVVPIVDGANVFYLFRVVAETDPFAGNSYILGFLITSYSGSVVQDRLLVPLIDAGGVPTAQNEFRIEEFIVSQAAEGAPETHFDIRVFTVGSDVSEAMRAGVSPVRLETQSCDETLSADICELGSFCDTVADACEPGTAPALVAISVDRTGRNEVALEIEGTDVDADVVGFRANLLNSAGAPVFLNESFFFLTVSGQTFGFELPVFGEVSFQDVEGESPAPGRLLFEIVGSVQAQAELEADLVDWSDVEITLLDSAGGESAALIVPVWRTAGDEGCDPTSGQAGGAYPAGPPYIPCQEALVCTANVCVSE